MVRTQQELKVVITSSLSLTPPHLIKEQEGLHETFSVLVRLSNHISMNFNEITGTPTYVVRINK